MIADSERGVFSLQGDLLELLQGAAAQPALPPISDQARRCLPESSDQPGCAIFPGCHARFGECSCQLMTAMRL